MPKLKDLPKNVDIVGMVIKVPKRLQVMNSLPKQKMYIKSGWIKGLWLTATPEAERIYPLCFDSFNDIKDLEVIMR